LAAESGSSLQYPNGVAPSGGLGGPAKPVAAPSPYVVPASYSTLATQTQPVMPTTFGGPTAAPFNINAGFTPVAPTNS